MITFRLYASVQFDRPIDRDEHYISPGGYEMTFNGKKILFDFSKYEGWVDKDDPTILHFMQKNPDYETFEGLKSLTTKDLKNLTGIEDFYIYTGEQDDPEIKPVKILKLAFRNFGSPGERIDEDYDFSQEKFVRDYSFEEE